MRTNRFALLLTFAAVCAFAQPRPTVEVVARPVERTIKLPADVEPYESVAVRARVSGFVERMYVDRGSAVKQGEMLARLSAPEMDAQVAEARAHVHALESERAEADARLVAEQNTYARMSEAAKTPGAIAGAELINAEKARDAAAAALRSKDGAIQAAQASLRSLEELRSYLDVRAPFTGMVTERFVHPGALVGPGAAGPIVELQQLARLRAVVPVPESAVGGIARGAQVSFTVPAYPARTFRGTVARIAHSLDAKTRTMAVELDVDNRGGVLAPGMYAEVSWPVRPGRPSLLVPPTSIVTTTERTFVIRVKDGRAEWVNVRRGPPAGDTLIEVYGALDAGDRILVRGTDEIREGTRIE